MRGCLCGMNPHPTHQLDLHPLPLPYTLCLTQPPLLTPSTPQAISLGGSRAPLQVFRNPSACWHRVSEEMHGATPTPSSKEVTGRMPVTGEGATAGGAETTKPDALEGSVAARVAAVRGSGSEAAASAASAARAGILEEAGSAEARAACGYTKCYCEENVYRLIASLISGALGTPCCAASLYAVFISNPRKQVCVYQCMCLSECGKVMA